MLCFNTALASSYCPWPISAALLGNASARNSICGPWCDIYIPSGGTITYSTAGVAPNRKFAATWCATRMYSCTTQWTTTQIIIYETSNLVEVHTAHKTICAWNGGYAITGVQNATGTAATAAPGRDYPSVWSVIAPPEAWRFTPTAGPSYTVAPIAYAPMPYATSGIYWYDSTTGAYLGSGPYLTVSPSVPTTYMAAALGCNDTTKAYIHILPASVGVGGIPHIDTYSYSHPTECGKCDGRITLHGVNPHQIDTVFWSFNGVPQPSYVDSAALDSTIVLNHGSVLCGGVYDYIYVKVLNCPSNQVGPITLVTPTLAISGTTFGNPTICGHYDGWIKLRGLTPYKPVSVAYIKGGVPQTPQTGMVAGDSTFTMIGLGAGTYTGIAATVGFCTAPGTPVTLTNPPPYMPSFTYNVGLGCQGDTIFVTNTTTPTGFYSYWDYNFGTAASALDSTRTWHIYKTDLNTPVKYVGSYVVALTYNTTPWHDPACALTFKDTVDIDHRIQAVFTPTFDSICRGVPITFNNASISNYSPKYYWLFGNGDVDNGTEHPVYSYNEAGNFDAELTVTDNIGCKHSVKKRIAVISLDITTSFHDTDVCLKKPLHLFTIPTLKNFRMPIKYAWTQIAPGTNLDKYDAQNPWFSGVGTYTLNVTAHTQPFGTGAPMTDGCEANDKIVIRSHPPVTIFNLTPSPQVVTLGKSLQLNADGGVYYRWSPENGTCNNPNINNPVITPKDSVTLYQVYVMNHWGCIDTAEVKVYVDQDVDQFVPTAFTPNGDGKNDIFRIIKMRFQKLVDFRVYNRWGDCVFQTANPEMGWDGTYKGQRSDMGTYVYEIIVALPDGVNKVYKGNVTLIR